MLEKLNGLAALIGNTPLYKMSNENINLYAKLEYYNFSGSIKDRPALNIIRKGILDGHINQDTIVIESSSGNLAIALALICKNIKVKFIPVIDPNINSSTESLLKLLSYDVIKIIPEKTNESFLERRIKVVKDFCAENPGAFWTNQYENPNNPLAYYHGLANEIKDHFKELDYVFIAVSSCGAIAGLSRKLKELFPLIKIIAVDVEGSVIFGRKPEPRYHSGIGAGIVPKNLKSALIDEIVYVSQLDIVKGCYDLLNETQIFAGASSGAVYFAVKEYFNGKHSNKNVMFICADKGTPYQQTIYNREWVGSISQKLSEKKDIASMHKMDTN